MEYSIEINNKYKKYKVLDNNNKYIFYKINYKQYDTSDRSFRKLARAVDYLQMRITYLENCLVDYSIYKKNNMYHVIIVKRRLPF